MGTIKPKTCAVCGRIFQPRSWNSLMTPLCSPDCKRIRREARQKRVTTPCKECGALVTVRGSDLWKASAGCVYCSVECKKRWTARRSAAVLADLNRRTSSARMRARNPMARAEIRAKVSVTLQKMAWSPPTRGGNGHAPTIPQSRLATLLEWPTEVVVPTGAPRDSGYPTNYKLDLGERDLKIGLEVDGASHYALRQRSKDAKKDAFLSGLGWTVLRFTNAQVLEDSASCVREIVSTTWRLAGRTTTSPTAS